MGKVKNFVDKWKPPKRSFKEWVKVIVGYIKRPRFFIPFLIAYLLLNSPIIVGVIMYIITKENRWWQIAISWFALTAPALPIPVLPISITVGITSEKVIKRMKTRRTNKHASDDATKQKEGENKND